MYIIMEKCKNSRHSSRILLLAAILAATLTGLFLASAFASVDADPVAGIGVDGSDENVGPDTFGVASIGNEAFEGYGTVTSLTIGGSAFEECSGLKAVSIPGSVLDIDEHAFNTGKSFWKYLGKGFLFGGCTPAGALVGVIVWAAS